MKSTPIRRTRTLIAAMVLYALVWLGFVLDWMAADWIPAEWRLAGIATGVVVAGLWILVTRHSSRLVRYLTYSIAYIPCWTFLVAAGDYLIWDGLRANLAQIGLGGLYLIGLAWVVWAVDRLSVHYERRRLRIRGSRESSSAILLESQSEKAIYNPFDPAAWYYGGRGKKLNQSITVLMTYSSVFTLLVLLLSNLRGCSEVFEMPAGGGGPGKSATMGPAVEQTVKIQKVIKKKFAINPFSSISLNVPPIEEVQLQLEEATRHEYSVSAGSGGPGGIGFGEGEGSGFAGGTGRGKVRFVRLEYAGGDWDQDFGVGSDLNMLMEYGIRTKQKVHTETESRTILQLRNSVAGKSLPFVYMTGQRSISLSAAEVKTLREYLLDKHGMIFCDNGGSRHFHNQFVEMMKQVLEGKVEPVSVPLDDVIHNIFYRVPFLPYVAPHGGKEALGWKVDGRWVAYYSPGDIADAWSDGHAGVKREIWEYCYQLGVNVMMYAYVEQSKWLSAKERK